MIKFMWQKNKKKIIIATCVIVGIICIVEYMIHPIVAAVFIGPVEHSGTELYTSEAYLKYRNAKSFQTELAKCDFIEECMITDFYHSDSWPLDTLFFGRVADTFCLDLQAGSHYEQIKQETIASSLETTELRDWDIYLISIQPCNRLQIYSNHFLIALNDATTAVRCILVADVRGNAEEANLITIMIHYSGIDWH